jgi:hypothetical protein
VTARRHPTLAAALIYLVLATVLFAQGLAPGRTLSASDHLWSATPWDSSRPADVPVLGSNREMADSVMQFQPPLQLTRDVLPDIPLWNPYILNGRPYLGDPQTQVFAPFSLPVYVLPFWKAQAVVAILKLFLAAFGAYLLGRALGMRFGGALVTGLAFGFSLWMVDWVSWTLGSVWVFLPWTALLSELSVRRPGPLPFAGLASVVGLGWLGGHPSSSLQVLSVVGLCWLVRALLLGREGLLTRLATLAGGFAVGTALAAVMLIPFTELLLRSSDLSVRAGASDLLHQPASDLLALFLHDWWGSGATGLELSFSLEHAYYVGALPLMLGAVALIARPSAARLATFGVGVATMAVATGITPFHDIVIALPGLEAANNGRFAVLAVLCLALLAGWGLDDLASGELAPGRRLPALAACLVLFAIPFAWVVGRIDIDALPDALEVAWGFADPAAGAVAEIRLASLLEWTVLGVLALVLVALRLRGLLPATAFVALAALLVAADLFKAGMGYNPAIPIEAATQPTTPAIRFLQSERPARFAGLVPRAPAALVLPLPTNVSMRYRLLDSRGYAQPTEERYFNVWKRLISPQRDCYYFFCTVLADTTPAALRGLGVLGVEHLLQNRRDDPLPDLQTSYDGSDARIYRNPYALPRAFLVDRQVVARDGDAALALLTSEGFPTRTVAVTEERLPGLATGTGGGASAGSARLAEDERERVVVETDAERPALLVLTDTWYPGWKAEVDGEEVPIERVDYVLRGVSVPAGRHRVEFTYRPASVRAGFAVSGAALLTIAAAALLGWRRRRAAARPVP